MIKIILQESVFRILFLICILSIEFLATTTIEIKVVENSWDKLNHFFAFFVLYILLSFAYKRLELRSKVFLLLLFGMQIEVVQHFIEGRYFSLIDVVADGVGILLGVLFHTLVLRKIKL